jgi:hypothetical protein
MDLPEGASAPNELFGLGGVYEESVTLFDKGLYILPF